jgi:predicted RNase H-like nuclease (RuvC/YqgF family)
MEKINCEYCNKLISKNQIIRHQNTKQCRNKQQNKDIILPLKEYRCKYCNKSFNRLDKKNEHENNKSCNTTDIIIKLEQKEKEIELKDEIIKQKNNEINIYKEENLFIKNQLETFKPNITNNDNRTIIINNLNINFSDIQNHLDKFDIKTLSNYDKFINELFKIFEGKIKLINECKQVISYNVNNKYINDIKAKLFLCNASNELYKKVENVCENNKIPLNNTEDKKANNLKRLLGGILSEDGVKSSIRQKGYNKLLIEIIKYLKENEYMDIQGV